MIHSCASGIPLAMGVYVRDLKDKYVYFELIFPPLDEGVDRVEFKEWIKAEWTKGFSKSTRLFDGIGWHFEDIKVETKLPYFASEEYQEQQNQKPRVVTLDKDFKPKN